MTISIITIKITTPSVNDNRDNHTQHKWQSALQLSALAASVGMLNVVILNVVAPSCSYLTHNLQQQHFYRRDREPLLKGRAQYSWPHHCTNYLKLAAFRLKIIFTFLQNKPPQWGGQPYWAFYLLVFPGSYNRTAHIRHQCRNTTVLTCHRCLINTGVKKWTIFIKIF
jgi:hypothetical protein